MNEEINRRIGELERQMKEVKKALVVIRECLMWMGMESNSKKVGEEVKRISDRLYEIVGGIRE